MEQVSQGGARSYRGDGIRTISLLPNGVAQRSREKKRKKSAGPAAFFIAIELSLAGCGVSLIRERVSIN